MRGSGCVPVDPPVWGAHFLESDWLIPIGDWLTSPGKRRMIGYMRATLCILLACGTWSYAQSVISAHSGVVQYAEGDVAIDNQAVHPKFAEFPELKPDQVIATQEGRVELLLTPGVFLRLSENSSVRMISNSLADTRVGFVSGSALIEVAELLENNAITFEAAGTPIVLARKGLYRFDSDPVRLRVYDGQARVGADGAAVTVRKGREMGLGESTLTAASFDTKDIDGFYRWSARRSEYVAAANLASAHVANDPRSSGYVGGLDSPVGRWSWNPWFGMFTYMPGGNGMYLSPFGYTYYSPAMVQMVYTPSPLAFRSGLPTSRGSLSAAPSSRSPFGGGGMGGLGGARGAGAARGPFSGAPAGGFGGSRGGMTGTHR